MTQAKLTKREISEEVTVLLNGNTVKFNYKYAEGDTPKAIEFKVYRGEKIDNKSVQAMGGNFPESGAFAIYNTSDRQKNDGVLSDDIYNLCLQIFNKELKVS